MNYQWQSNASDTTWSNIIGATSTWYEADSLTQDMNYRRSVVDACGNIAYSDTISVTMQTLSTAPTPTPVPDTICPNSSVSLVASGGIAGTGSTINWYSDAAATNLVGSDSSILVSPTQTTTYYVRRESTCDTTALQPLTINVRDYVYVSEGNHLSTNFCDDDSGWKHFLDANDNIILSVQGDFSGLSSVEVSINNNGEHHQETENAPITSSDCTNDISPGEERFELPRRWNINYTGTLSGVYSVRYYFPATEKTNMITAAINHMDLWPDCFYNYKYANPDGFYWFKNTGTPYVAPAYDGSIHLTSTEGTTNGMNYSELSGITSFSGGSGAIILRPGGSLPIDLIDFSGINQGETNSLNWATASEFNNDYFELERTANLAEGFVSICEIDGAGTTTDVQQYAYIDESPVLGINYYRLKQVDFNGITSYSKVIALEVNRQANSYTFYPNPTMDEVTYQFNSLTADDMVITVTNTLGQYFQVLNYSAIQGSNAVKIDLSNYPSGSYLIQVSGTKMIDTITEIITKTE